MSLYNYFLANPFGPGARTLEWIYLAYQGGGLLDLDSELTYGANTDGTNCRLVAINNTTAEIWQLIDGTEPTDTTNGWLRPADFDASTNPKVWKRLLVFTTGGTGGGIDLVTNEVPLGMINGSNQSYMTARSFRASDIDIFLNGLRQKLYQDYTISTPDTFLMTTAPLVGDTLVVDYVPL